ncbi:MAG: hypothetical protein M3O34_20320 [Chloroflexota bacterium]|nr:hypothetical protein [Chloroflexota bacterium]
MRYFGAASPILTVPRNVVDKVVIRHPTDLAALTRLSELIDRWAYAGLSPVHAERLEIYGILDGIWYTAVLRLAGTKSDANVLVTFHRQYARKVLGRARQGRILRRDEIEDD